jgi:hypothetical protein
LSIADDAPLSVSSSSLASAAAATAEADFEADLTPLPGRRAALRAVEAALLGRCLPVAGLPVAAASAPPPACAQAT